MPSPRGKRNFAWEGSSLCAGFNADRSKCGNFEVDGLDFCMHHMPIELLAEAEEVTGIIRCRHPVDGTKDAAGDICSNFAVKGTDPPRCKVHGANAGSVISKRAADNVIQGEVDERFKEIMTEHGDRLLNPARLGNPLDELEMVCAEMKVFKDLLRNRVTTIGIAEWGTFSRSEEVQIRAEIVLYERAIERLANCLINIIKLDIEKRRAAIEDRQVHVIETALVLALEASGADLEGQAKARKVLMRELTTAEQ